MKATQILTICLNKYHSIIQFFIIPLPLGHTLTRFPSIRIPPLSPFYSHSLSTAYICTVECSMYMKSFDTIYLCCFLCQVRSFTNVLPRFNVCLLNCRQQNWIVTCTIKVIGNNTGSGLYTTGVVRATSFRNTCVYIPWSLSTSLIGCCSLPVYGFVVRRQSVVQKPFFTPCKPRSSASLKFKQWVSGVVRATSFQNTWVYAPWTLFMPLIDCNSPPCMDLWLGSKVYCRRHPLLHAYRVYQHHLHSNTSKKNYFSEIYFYFEIF